MMPEETKNTVRFNPLELILIILLAALIIIVSGQVLIRYLFSHTFGWSSELSRFLFIWCSLLAAAIALKQEEHYKCTFFLDKLSSKPRNFVLLFNYFLMGIGVAVLIWHGITAAKLGGMQDYPSLPFSRFWQYIALPTCSCLMFYYLIRRMIIIIADLKGLFVAERRTPHEAPYAQKPKRKC